MNLPAVYQFPTTGQGVRVVVQDGEPWFIARDVTDVLDLANITRALAGLDDDEKGFHSVNTPGGRQNLTIVNEPGLYSLILRSRKPEAKTFKRWVTHEVLPQIRRTGTYGTPAPAFDPATLTRTDILRMALESEQERLALEARVGELEPKAAAYDDLMDADGCYSMDATAKILSQVTRGMGRNNLFRWLREQGVLQTNNLPYQRYNHWFKVVPVTFVRHGQTCVDHTTKVLPTGVTRIRALYLRTNPAEVTL